ncbi:galactoside O-acetyltransferase [Fibrobacteria bacterium R8-3-H12]
MSTSFYQSQELAELGLKSYGKNVFVSRKCSIYGASNISIGNNVRIDDFCVLSGKIEIGNFVHIAVASLLFGGEQGIIMKDFSNFSSRCAVYAKSDDYSGEGMTNPMVPDEFKKVCEAKVIIGRHVVIGSGTTILPGVEIGEGSSVGAMGLVTKSLEAWGIFVGSPVRKLKDRDKRILSLEEEFLARFLDD